MSFLTFARIAIVSAFRARAAWLIGFLFFLILGVGWLAAAFSLRQPLVVAVDIGFSALRGALLFLIVVWTQELLAKDMERRTLYWIAAFPISRWEYLIGRMVGMLVLLAISTGVLTFALWLLGRFAHLGYTQSTLLARPGLLGVVSFGIYIEAVVVASVTIMFQSLSRTPFLAQALGIAIAVAGRAWHSSLAFLVYSPDATVGMKRALIPGLDWIRWILPDLTRLDWRDAVLYGSSQSLALAPNAVVMALSYAGLATLVAVMYFERRSLD